jgi:hypothetical protein
MRVRGRPEEEKIVFKGAFSDGATPQLVSRIARKVPLGEKNCDRSPTSPRAPWLAFEMTDASLRQQVRRLRNETTQRLAVDFGAALGPDGIIENRQREGYRLSNVLREVSLGSF